MCVSEIARLSGDADRITRGLQSLSEKGFFSKAALDQVSSVRHQLTHALRGAEGDFSAAQIASIEEGIVHAYYSIIHDFLQFIDTYVEYAMIEQGVYLSKELEVIRRSVGSYWHRHSRDSTKISSPGEEYDNLMRRFEIRFRRCEGLFKDAVDNTIFVKRRAILGSGVESVVFASIMVFGLILLLSVVTIVAWPRL